MAKWLAPRHGASEEFLRAHINHKSDACLMWPYGKSTRGYGTAVVGGKQKPASRWMCILAHGEPGPLKKHAAHRCGNPGCVNPRHLRWATHRENMRDKDIHGTHNRGERNGKTALTKADVAFIRSAPPNLAVLAERFGMSRYGISKIRHGKRWGHVPGAVPKDAGGRNTMCRHGHRYDEANTHWTKNGYRTCRACDASAAKRRRHEKASPNSSGNPHPQEH